jgi:hypothetical protein
MQLLNALAIEHGFDRVVVTRRGLRDEAGTDCPARGEDPLALTLFVHEVWHRWEGASVYYGSVSVTHVQSGYRVGQPTHPFATECDPDRLWTIPATPAGIALAETLRQRCLRLDVPWTDLPEDEASRLEILAKIAALEPDAKTCAKIEREALRLFRAELKARDWPYYTKTQIATIVREHLRSRFHWNGKVKS